MPLLAHGRWYSRLVRVVAALLVLAGIAVAVGWFFGGPFISRVVTEKLKTTVAQQLNARLEIKHLQYRFPYGVQMDGAELWSTTPGEPSIKLVGFDRLDLQLGKFPLRSGPLVIQQADLRRPTLYVIETKKDGFIGLKHLLKANDQKKQEASPKLSEVLRLRHVQLFDARVEYDDRTISKSVPFVWDKLGLILSATPHDYAAPYHFDVTAGNGDTAKVQVAGTLDLDALVLTLDKLTLAARLVAGEPISPLPAGVQRVLNTLHVSGGGHAVMQGVIPFTHASTDLDLTGDFVIDDAQGKLSSETDATPLADLNVTGGIHMHGREVTVNVKTFGCRRGPLGVSFSPVTVQYSLPTDRWTTTPIRGAIAYAPPASATGLARQHAVAMLSLTLAELKERDQFRVNVSGTTLSLPDSVGDLKLEGAARYDDDGIAIEAARIDGLGGPVLVAGQINDTTTSFAGEVDVKDADLSLFNRLFDPDVTRQLHGRLSAHVAGAATVDLDAVRGEGRFHVDGGEFAKVPILGGLADALKIGQKAFTANEASGHFVMTPTKLTFDRIALNTTVLSVRGVGDIGYDSHLNLSVYADGHWRERPKEGELYIPVLSDLGRAIAGAGAYTFGSVSRQFTHFTVTGTMAQPKLTLSPAPVVTENLKKLFEDE